MLPARLPPDRFAFFLDFDGTLSEIVDEPHRATVQPHVLKLLQSLRDAAHGAVAVVSGRSIGQLDRMLYPLRLPSAGVHGAERRDHAGNIHRSQVDNREDRWLAGRVREFAASRAGLVAEHKPGAIALHYRQRPELAAESLLFAAALAHEHAGLHLVRGKKVVELKLSARTKGDAIADFMMEPPFAGRRPFFAGDDVTDEAGFARVNSMGGISLKVGGGQSAASHRAGTIRELVEYLEQSVAPHEMTRGRNGT